MRTSWRRRASVLSAYIDSLIIHLRNDQSSEPTSQHDTEFDALRQLAADLSRIEVVPPPEFAERLEHHIRNVAATQEPAPAWRRRAWLRVLLPIRQRVDWSSLITAPALRMMGTAAAVFLILIAVPYRNSAPTVSAADVLTRAQDALAKSVRPGELMFRRWRTVERVRERPGGPERVQVRFLSEWVDGADPRTAAARSRNDRGEVEWAYVSEAVGNRDVPRVYYAPGFTGTPRGLVSIVPTRAEFESAVARFPSHLQPMLNQYLARGFLPYHPVLGELRTNEVVLKDVTDRSPVAPIRLSLDTSSDAEGRTIFRLRVVDPLRVHFRWKIDGPPDAWLATQEVVRYIYADTYLNARTETLEQDEHGRVISSTRELIETRIVNAAAAGVEPFVLQVPSGVPVRRQEALEDLWQVARALDRAHTFLSAVRAEPIATGEGR